MRHNPNQTAYVGRASVTRLSAVLNEIDPKSVFLVADAGAYSLSGAEAAVRPALNDREVILFDEFQPNPQLADIERGVDRFRGAPAEAIVAVGGGTAIDVAKLVGNCGPDSKPVRDLLTSSDPIGAMGPPLVAIPTTAGTGSEATPFAVVYIDGIKHSIADPGLLPDYALVDPELTSSMPPGLTAHTGLDALAQALESLWSVNATSASLSFSREALDLAWTHLSRAVLDPDPNSRSAMCRAAHLSGRAIAISKTTACHALSYTLTARFGVPHGLAVALTLGPVLVYNSCTTAENVANPAGPAHVRALIQQICSQLGVSSPSEAAGAIREMMQSIGCPTTLSEVGAGSGESVEILARGVNPDRLANNPRRMSRSDIDDILAQVR